MKGEAVARAGGRAAAAGRAGGRQAAQHADIRHVEACMPLPPQTVGRKLSKLWQAPRTSPSRSSGSRRAAHSLWASVYRPRTASASEEGRGQAGQGSGQHRARCGRRAARRLGGWERPGAAPGGAHGGARTPAACPLRGAAARRPQQAAQGSSQHTHPGRAACCEAARACTNRVCLLPPCRPGAAGCCPCCRCAS